ncbi:MAG: ABC transporter permease [Thermoleophilia bacterium]|nr:ABC transporter permease [Thermoleophilia bacterium]
MNVLMDKELRELRKTYRFIILPLVFVFFGIGGPTLIRLLPVLLRSTPADLQISLPDFGPADGLAQFLELSRQLGLLAVVVIYMGIVAGERREGMLALLFVKPISRLAYLASRWGVNAAYVAVSFLAGSGFALMYTHLLLGRPEYGTMAVVTALYLSYVVLAYSWTTFFSTWMRNPAAAAGLSILMLFVLPVVGILWQPLADFGPYGAVSAGTAALGSAGIPAEALPASAAVSAVLNLLWSGGLVLGAYGLLRRAEL